MSISFSHSLSLWCIKRWTSSTPTLVVRPHEGQKALRHQLFNTMCLPKLGPAPQINPHMNCYTSKSTGLIEFSHNVNIFHELSVISFSLNYRQSMPPTILITRISASLLLAEFLIGGLGSGGLWIDRQARLKSMPHSPLGAYVVRYWHALACGNANNPQPMFLVGRQIFLLKCFIQ